MAYEPSSMPGCATGQLFTLKQNNIGDAQFGQMIGHRATNNATANNDDLALLRKRGHQLANRMLAGS